jgi:ATP-dependent exoDNAse (exonuclease V) beta subunit
LAADLKPYYARRDTEKWPAVSFEEGYTLSFHQRVVGRIDLLIQTTDSLVVVDHKLAGKSKGKEEEMVAGWAPKLEMYGTAIARAIGKPPAETCVNLPREGRVVRVRGEG